MTIRDRLALWFRPTWVTVIREPTVEPDHPFYNYIMRLWALNLDHIMASHRLEIDPWLAENAVPYRFSKGRIAFARPNDALMFKLRFYECS